MENSSERKKSYQLDMKQYEMRSYWDKRAKYYAQDLFLAVCDFTAPPWLNHFFHIIRANTLRKLLSQISSLEGKSIIEVGCGVGRWVKVIKKRKANYTGFDVSTEMLKIAKKGTLKEHFVNASAHTIPFQENVFDLAFSVAVLHHIPYEKQIIAIKEMIRVVKPNGYILISEGTHPHRTFNYFPNKQSQWRKNFEDNGCEVVKIIHERYALVVDWTIKLIKKIKFKQFSLATILERFNIYSFCLYFVERFSAIFLPAKYSQGVGILFKKVRVEE